MGAPGNSSQEPKMGAKVYLFTFPNNFPPEPFLKIITQPFFKKPSKRVFGVQIIGKCSIVIGPGGEKGGKEGPGPSPITATLMFQAMASMSPGGGSSGSANKDTKDQNHDQSNIGGHYDKKHYDNENG